MEKPVGKVTHYFPRIGVAVVALSDDLKQGEEIRITGTQTDFKQTVISMQIEHKTIANAMGGQEIGLKVDRDVKVGDRVLKTG
jgi:translation elongation factor EF-Tu-like GTPase